jgi:site-specific DNA recombinase
MAEELKDPRLIETYVLSYNSERERLAGNASAVRTRIEAELQRNIDLVIKYVISEDDAKQRIAGLKEERLRVEAELAAPHRTASGDPGPLYQVRQ